MVEGIEDLYKKYINMSIEEIKIILIESFEILCALFPPYHPSNTLFNFFLFCFVVLREPHRWEKVIIISFDNIQRLYKKFHCFLLFSSTSEEYKKYVDKYSQSSLNRDRVMYAFLYNI